MIRFLAPALVLAFTFLLYSPGHSAASWQESERPTSFWPEGVEFDVAIPTPEEHFGFDVGERHLRHAQLVSYMRLLAESSDRISIEQYGLTHGHRPLMLLTITSQQNRERLEQIQESHRQLAGFDSRSVDFDGLPAVINMGYGVHGDEPSATNCSPLVAYYLAAAQGDEVESWLDSCVILLDPSLNPDGFNRFANWANRYRGVVPNPDRQHAEHNQMWPPGRVNYYWFDLNRDWLPLVHPESRGRMVWYHNWKPNVVLDFHEMGTGSTYFFQPGIPERTNPLTPARNVELTQQFAAFHGRALDDKGSLYFTRERFDDFYMGKGSTYPDLHGAVGILFEQASSRGHVQMNQDGLLTFHQTISNQFTTSLSSLRATTALREELLEYEREFYRNSLRKAENLHAHSMVFTCRGNRTRLKDFADVLVRHDIECYWLTDDATAGDRQLDARWTLVVPMNQPEYRFLRSLLMRRTEFQENIFYDVSAWTLSLAFGVEQFTISGPVESNKLLRATLENGFASREVEISDDDVAWLIEYREDGAVELLARLLENEVRVRVAMKPLKAHVNGPDGPREKAFDYGTLSVAAGIQPDKLDVIKELLTESAEQGVSIWPVRSGLATSGIDIGSPNFPVIPRPGLAMAVGRGVSAYGAGEIWHLLDHRFRTPVTLIKSSQLESADLDDYSTFIMPSGSYSDDVWAQAESFAQTGGTVVVVGRTAVTANERLGSPAEGSQPVETPAVPENAQTTAATEATSEQSSDEEAVDDPTAAIQQPFASASSTEALKLISGAIFRTQIDPTHPLMFGLPSSDLAVFRDHARMLEPSSSPYANPAIYDRGHPLLAGYCSDENVESLKEAASIVVVPHGRGRFILMTDNPNFRGFWRSTSRVFINAVLFGEFVDP
ncbi:MAG: M14 family metallopeptidase [Planctomycetota bacterium]